MFNKGDVVKVGKRGSVNYTVFMTHPSGVVSVQSHNTGAYKEYHSDKLVLVESVQDVAETAGCSVEELDLRTDTEREADEQAQIARDEILTGTVASPKDEHTSYQKAILRALNVLSKHVYGGTAKNRPVRKSRKLAKQARRNAIKSKNARFLELTTAEEQK